MQRIGLYGGSFDPIHLGHLLVAQAAFEEAALDRLHLIPAAQSPFKPCSRPASAELRLKMIRASLSGQSRCVVDDREIRRGGVSYTIETVREFQHQYPNAELHYLVGADLVATLGEWKAADEIASRVRFLVIPRPGEGPVALPAPFEGRVLKGFPMQVSSSQIRARIQKELPVHWLVAAEAEAIIRNNRLYL